jgi:hypothetical protein
MSITPYIFGRKRKESVAILFFIKMKLRKKKSVKYASLSYYNNEKYNDTTMVGKRKKNRNIVIVYSEIYIRFKQMYENF